MRAMTLILGGWVVGRVAALTLPGEQPVDQIAAVAAAVVPPAQAARRSIPMKNDAALTKGFAHLRDAPVSPLRQLRQVQPRIDAAVDTHRRIAPIVIETALGAAMSNQGATAKFALSSSAIKPSSSRLSGNAWLLARPGRGGSLATGGQLGASQGGVRVNYAVAGPVFVTARASAPFDGLGRQASVGIGIKGKRVGLIVERWVALDRGGRDDFALTAYGGIDGIELPTGARLDAYAQAGIVGRDGFADGAVRIERDAASVGGIKVAVGAGAWAGIQPGVSRIDIGPQIVARVPIARRTLRLSTEWRQRVAGQAAPASGPALTLGLDF